ncbi:MAG: EpsG family protein [Novosphingobium sp.]|nr:EpsG family protein [Novosphingobium sp.]
MTYVIVYLLLLIAGLSRGKGTEGTILWLSLAFLLFFMGGRMDVGCDFQTYAQRFRYTPTKIDWNTFWSQTEPFWEMLNILVRRAGLDFMWLNYAASAIMLAGYVRFVRILPNPVLLLALLFPIMLVQLGMSGVRQGIAVGLLLSGAVDFTKGRRIVTAGWIVLAAQFHSSAVVFLPIALLAQSRVNTVRLLVAVAVATPAIAVLLGERMEVYQDRYIDDVYGEMTSNGAVIRYILAIFPCLLFVWYRERMRAVAGTSYNLLYTMAIVAASISVTGVVNLVILHRMTFYVMPFAMAMWIFLLQDWPFEGTKKVVRFVPGAIIGGYLVFWLTLSRHADLCFTPYQNYAL